MSTEFRQAVEKPTAPVKVSEAPIMEGGSPVETHAPELVATYSDDMGNPYVAKYLDIEAVWDKEPSLAREIKEIEGYIQQQVKDGKLDNSTKAADKFLTELERKAGLTRYESSNKRISALLAYIDFQKVVNA